MTSVDQPTCPSRSIELLISSAPESTIPSVKLTTYVRAFPWSSCGVRDAWAKPSVVGEDKDRAESGEDNALEV